MGDHEFEIKCSCDSQIINATSELELLRIIALKLSSMDYRLTDIQQNLWAIKYKNNYVDINKERNS